jgi:polyhydroxyalkanoate synthesis regulator phasin
MKLKQSLVEKILDVRLRDRLVAEGKISKQDIDKYLAELPEEASTAYEAVSALDAAASTEQNPQ